MSLIFGLIVIFASALVALASLGHIVAENKLLRATLAVAREDALAARRVARRAMRRTEFAEAQERAAIRAEVILRMRVEALEATLRNTEARLRAAEALLDTAVEEAAETAGRLRSAEALLFLDEDEDEPDVVYADEGVRVRGRSRAGWWPEEDAPLRAAAS